MKAARALMVASTGGAVAVSVGLLALSIYLALSGSGSACAQPLDASSNAMGAVLLSASILGLIGALAHEGCLEFLFLCCSAALTLALLAYSAFALAVTAPSPSATVGAAGQAVYSVAGFSSWLQGLVAQPEAWEAMRTCLVSNSSCPALPPPWRGAGGEMGGIHKSSSNSSSIAAASGSSGVKNPSVIQSGCCFSPAPCSTNTTLSTTPILSSAPSPAPSVALSPVAPAALPAPSVAKSSHTDNHLQPTIRTTAVRANSTSFSDCTSADPGGGGRCFSCDTCKAALLKVVRDDLSLAGCVCLTVSCLLVVLLGVGGYGHALLRRERREKAREEMRKEDDYSCGSFCSGGGSCGDCCECAMLCCAGLANCLGECGR